MIRPRLCMTIAYDCRTSASPHGRGRYCSVRCCSHNSQQTRSPHPSQCVHPSSAGGLPNGLMENAVACYLSIDRTPKLYAQSQTGCSSVAEAASVSCSAAHRIGQASFLPPCYGYGHPHDGFLMRRAIAICSWNMSVSLHRDTNQSFHLCSCIVLLPALIQKKTIVCDTRGRPRPAFR